MGIERQGAGGDDGWRTRDYCVVNADATDVRKWERLGAGENTEGGDFCFVRREYQSRMIHLE